MMLLMVTSPILSDFMLVISTDDTRSGVYLLYFLAVVINTS